MQSPRPTSPNVLVRLSALISLLAVTSMTYPFQAEAKPLAYDPVPPQSKRLRILFVTIDARGHFSSYPGLWDGLTRRGHDVTVAFPPDTQPLFDEYRSLYENEGLANLRELHTGNSTAGNGSTAAKMGPFKSLMTMVPILTNGAAVQIPALDAWVTEHGKPDVVVHDMTAFAGPALCRKHDVPCVCASVMLNRRTTFMENWRPPLGMRLDPISPSFAHRLVIAVGGQVSKWFRAWLFGAVMRRCDELIGNAPQDNNRWFYDSLGCGRGGVELVPVTPGLDQSQVHGPEIAFVGPMRDMERFPPLEPKGKISLFLDKAHKDGVDVVFMAMGVTVPISEDHVEKRTGLVEDLTRDGSIRVLWGNRRMMDSRFPLNASSAALVVPWAPQEAVLRHPATKVFVTHGGSTSMMESVAAGVPLVCSSQGFEQGNNCLLLQRREAGIYVPRGAPASDIALAVKNILANRDAYEMNVKKVWSRVQSFGSGDDAKGARRAVEVVESVGWNGVDHLIPEVCKWPLYQQYHLDVALFVVVVVWACKLLMRRTLRMIGRACGGRQWSVRWVKVVHNSNKKVRKD